MLEAWSQGDAAALERLAPIIYRDLRRIARRRLAGEPPGNTLTTSALVNEAWLRLAGVRAFRWQDRAHFFAMCARMMRRILVDHARARMAAKRGGAVPPLPLEEALVVSDDRYEALASLDEALTALSALDPRKGRVVELRFFGGLSVHETAEVLGVSPDSVKRDWKLARLWLARECNRGGSA